MLLASTSRPDHPTSCSAREQRRGAEVVLGDVVGDVGEVDAESDHRGLVAHRVDAAHELA